MTRPASPATPRVEALYGLSFWAMIALAWLICLPALHGAFIFDDFPNLEGLAELSHEGSLSDFIRFIQAGASGPLGRPVALATFALQHASWPVHAQDFIRFNILLHLLNGSLLAWWLLRWQRLAPSVQPYLLVPLLVTLLWLLAPMQANAVFYVVQRMAVLATTFMFLGLLLHTMGRQRAIAGSPRTGYALMTAGMAVGFGLGVFTKESAALYPLLVLVYESTLLRAVPRPPRWNVWNFAFLKVPALALLLYLLWFAFTADTSNPARPASWERLLIEGRILFVYLYKLLLPPLYGTRLMYDDYLATAPLLFSWPTLLYAAGWLAAIVLAIRKRASWPHFSFALLWFLGAHLLESTVIPLELAFEHRNYPAIVGPLLFLVTGFGQVLRQRWIDRTRVVLHGAAAAYVLFVAFGMWQTAMLWGRPEELALFWSDRQPESRRALKHAGNSLLLLGMNDEAQKKLAEGMARWPRDPTLPLSLLQASCQAPDLPVPDVDALAKDLRNPDGHVLTILNMLDGVLRLAESGDCRRLPARHLEQLTIAVLDAPALAGYKRFTYLLRSRSAELAGDREAARLYLDRAIHARPRIPLLQQGVIWALQADDLERAKGYLEIAETSEGIAPLERWSLREEIGGMRQLIDLYEAITTHEPGA